MLNTEVLRQETKRTEILQNKLQIPFHDYNMLVTRGCTIVYTFVKQIFRHNIDRQQLNIKTQQQPC